MPRAEAPAVPRARGPVSRAPAPSGDGEAALVRGAKAGSRDAAEALFARHWDRAWRTALAVTGRREAADDVAQTAFERAFGALASFDADRPFGPWLHRIVVNAALDVVRRERRLVLVPDPPEEPAAGPSPEADDRRALAALARLGPDRRVAVALRYILDYRPHEIAEMLGVPVGTVNSRLTRGVAELRESLEGSDA
ncbi:MAG: RNA polymerase sigma factor [Thermoleophilia bacterium]